MLEGLDRVNWKELGDPYGSAAAVPDLIRALASANVDNWVSAVSPLMDKIFLAGTVSSATSHAVPFLIELLESPAVQNKPSLLAWLAALACGRSYHALFPPRQGESDQEEGPHRIRKELAWAEATRDAVAAGVPTYLKFLDSGDGRVRSYAAYTLAVARTRAAEIFPRLRERLGAETDNRVKASILLCFGCVGSGDDCPALEEWLHRPGHPATRAAAALSVARLARGRMPLAAVQVLCEALSDPEPIIDIYGQLPWWDEDSVVSAVSHALSQLGPSAAEAMAPRMLDALERHCRNDRESVSLVGAILTLCFDTRSEKRRASELTELQRQVLTRLARCPRVWEWLHMPPDHQSMAWYGQSDVERRMAFRQYVATREGSRLGPRTWDWGDTIVAFPDFGLPGDRPGLVEFLKQADQK
jgi:HEAT repeat protein